MPCLFCKSKSESFTRSIPATEDNAYYKFPIDDIVGKAKKLFPELYQCMDCQSLWVIKTRGTGDPRSTYPEIYEQTAVRLDDETRKIINNLTLKGLLSFGDNDLPYSFRKLALNQIQAKETTALKELYLSQDQSLHFEIKLWLENWFQEQFPEEFLNFKDEGYHEGAEKLFEFSETQSLLASEFISIDEYLLFLRNEEDNTHTLECRTLKGNKIQWQKEIPAPFLEGLQIPFLFYQSGYLCSFHGFQNGSEYYNKLHRPDRLIIHSLDGKVLLDISLSLKCYEVLSTEERGISENRLVHNFKFSLFDGILYLPSKNHILIYDLNEKKIIREVLLPDEQVFSGDLNLTEEGSYFVKTLRGVIIFDSNWKVESKYKSNYHPVFIDFNLNVFYYYAIVENLVSKDKTVFSEKVSDSFSLTRTLAAPPVSLPTSNFIPFAMEKSYFLDFENKILNEISFTTNDTIGPHAYGDSKLPYLVSDESLTIFQDYKSLVLLDFQGNTKYSLEIATAIKKLNTFDGKHIVFVLENSNGYGLDDNYQLFVLNPEGRVIKTLLLRSLEGFAINFDGFLLVKYRQSLLKFDLFQGVQ